MQRPWLLVVATLLVVALAVLATLQVRWINDLSDADEQRRRGALDVAARRLGDELTREAMRAHDVFDQAPRDAAGLLRRYEEWKSGARDPKLIAAIYAADTDGDSIELSRLDTGSGALVPVPWNAALDAVRPVVRAGPDMPAVRRTPIVAEIPAVITPLRPEARPNPPPPERRPPNPPPWMDGGPPPPRERPFAPPPQARPRRTTLIIALDRAALASLVQDMAAQTLPDTDVTLLSGDAPDPKGDAVVVPTLVAGPGRNAPDAPRAYWRLAIRPRGIPLTEIVAAARRRNLGISFAILALLLGSFVLLAVLARRAERLRVQQLEFVAGITHELNTPLAALTSAGQNLADGIVGERDQVTRYGAMIVKESRRLSETVAQVLDFAGMQSRRVPASVTAVDVRAVVEDAVAQCGWLAEEAKVKIETQIASGVPAVGGDADALTRAVQNLVANAIRH
ncbi:MAG TPA: HAMP domain-containing sensor histidine kinase, partial [Thermoanaerobaculia bacterium]|nr:HAMP domain-containing sensor histidine kinase [Thermoanaerobaculia bacterium]